MMLLESDQKDANDIRDENQSEELVEEEDEGYREDELSKGETNWMRNILKEEKE